MSRTLANERWRSLGQGCRNVADAQGAELTCQAAQGEGDQIGQPSVAENLAIEGFDALLPSPRTDANPVPAMEAAEAAGIPVLDVDDAVIPQARHCVGDVQRDSGVRVAQWLIDRHLEGGKAAVIEGQAGAHAAGQRTAGFTKTAEGAGFEVVAGVAADRSRELACNARPSGGVPRGRQGRRRGRAPRRGDPGELAQRAHAGGRAGLLPAPRHRHHCRDADRPGGPGEAR